MESMTAVTVLAGAAIMAVSIRKEEIILERHGGGISLVSEAKGKCTVALVTLPSGGTGPGEDERVDGED
jgi:hypothetical protein